MFIWKVTTSAHIINESYIEDRKTEEECATKTHHTQTTTTTIMLMLMRAAVADDANDNEQFHNSHLARERKYTHIFGQKSFK